MVMGIQKNRMWTNLLRSIRSSLGRYIAIVAIIALGAGFFTGLRVTKSDMIATNQRYTDQKNMFDLRVINPYGWTESDVEVLSQTDGISYAEGAVYADAMVRMENRDDDFVYRIYSVPEQINQVGLKAGRMPSAPDECLLDAHYMPKSIIGSQILISQDNSDSVMERLRYDRYTVVGLVSSPLYLDIERGSTTIGNGSIAAFMYIPLESFQDRIFSEIHFTLAGDYENYSDDYNDAMDHMAQRLEEVAEPLAQGRLTQVREEAEAEYAKGLQEYEDGRAAYEQGKADAQLQLAEAAQKLADGRQEIAANRKTLEDGRKQLADGQKLLEDGMDTLQKSQKALADSKKQTFDQLAAGNNALLENYKTVNTNLRQVEDGLAQVDSGLVQLDSGITQLEGGLTQLEQGLKQIDTLIGILDPSITAAQAALDAAKEQGTMDPEALQALEQRLEELKAKRDEFASRRESLEQDQAQYASQLEELKAQREDLAAKQKELQTNQAALLAAKEQIDTGFLEAQNAQTQANNQFAALEAQLNASAQELEQKQRLLNQKQQELEDGEAALAEAEQQLSQGQTEYDRQKDQADKKLDDGARELDDAKRQLADAREAIDTLAAPQVYALTRNSNVGYVSFENNSDIVAGVSRVFPVFFLLVAALVCITTMTRMVDEERTQIGILKALGYGNGAIIGKYLAYSGSAALLGCVLGVIFGSIVFPTILWQAYCILYSFSDTVVLQFDIPLCVSIVLIYTAVTMAVTWYSCRRELRDVPAELIRPKAPTAGKKILFERFRLWNRVSFLNKVAIRNIFRYRQRLAMMLLGIGGCAALLVTGFGIKDSIVNIVSFQYDEVTLYDISISFQDGLDQTAQQNFRARIDDVTQRVVFCYNGGAELDFGGGVKETQLLAVQDNLEGVFDLHRGNQKLDVPRIGEALISVGVAEAMGIDQGDRITVRTPEMETLELTVAGIFDNHVYNYVVVSQDTVASQWGQPKLCQTALVLTGEDQDVHEAGAVIANQPNVLRVTVSQDLAGQVASMMDAMDAVVWLVVICAALLAVIVLYNLTNINITERVREIATLKVLGFYAGESAAYVFKENLALSAMGAVLGLGFGKLLHMFVMDQIRIDMVWFQSRVAVRSYLLAILITMLSAVVVDVILYFKLERINMAEALKSVE